MPLHAYKTYVGYAPDRINATVTSAVASSAVSLPIQNTVGTTGTLSSGGASYTAFILDGVNSESKACTGNLSAGAIAVTALTNAHPANVYVYFQLTASIGPVAYFPLDKFEPQDEYAQLLQETYTGSAGKTVAAVQGLRTASFGLGGPVFVDTLPYLVGGHLGAEDYTTGPPYTHAFSVQNSTANLQPVAGLIYNYDGLNCRVFSGKFSDVTLTYDPKALLKHDTKFLSRASGIVATPTPSFSAVLPVASWTAYLTINSVSLSKVETFDVTMSREASEAIPVLQGIQDPYTIWLGVETFKGKFTAVKEDDVLLNYYINETQPPLLLTCIQGTGTGLTEVNVQMTVCNIAPGKVVQQGKPYVTEEYSYEGILNSTDATTAGTGLSPGKVTVKNAVSGSTNYT